MCCPHNTEKGNEHEQICKSIACYMALSIPPGLGTEVSVSDAAGADRQGSAEMCHGILSAVGVRDSGDEHSGGPCALVGEGAAEDVDLGVDGRPEGTNRNSVVQSVSDVTEEALLGQSLLGQELLRGHGWSRQWNDTEVCAVSREGRIASPAASIGAWTKRTFYEGPLGVPPLGGIKCAPSGGHKAKPRSTNVVRLLRASRVKCAAEPFTFKESL